MESLQNLRRRSRGVKNIGQITKAMELVAATKMRRSQELALASRAYAWIALELLGTLSELKEVELPELLLARPVKKTALVLVASDKGLAGAFNSAVFRKFEAFIKAQKINPHTKRGEAAIAAPDKTPRSGVGVNLQDSNYVFIAVGQKAKTYLERRRAVVSRAFTRFGDFTRLEEVAPLAEFLISGFLNHDFDQILGFSTHFRTALRQDVLSRQILPIDYKNLKASARELIPESGRFSELAKEMRLFSAKNEEYLIEPSPREVLEKLAPYLVQMQVYGLILEANASEHSARRLAMKNASDNAGKLSAKLTLFYNKSRQAAITRELLEITAGAEALK